MNDSATIFTHATHVARRRDPYPKGDPDASRADQRDTTQGGEHGPRGRDALRCLPAVTYPRPLRPCCDALLLMLP